jgi:hypothetical protein
MRIRRDRYFARAFQREHALREELDAIYTAARQARRAAQTTRQVAQTVIAQCQQTRDTRTMLRRRYSLVPSVVQRPAGPEAGCA